jgi:DNA-binding MarR family transcriptional regulator
VSKQAAGQLVDVLVVRGYLDRFPDPDDRRRMTVALTERGRAAAAAARTAIERVDADLAARVGAEHLAHARATLAALMAAGHHEHDHDHDHQHDHEHEHEHAV